MGSDGPFWSLTLQDLLLLLNSSRAGLAAAEAERRLAQHGPNSLRPDTNGRIIRLLLRQFTSPIVLLLLGAALLSFVLHDSADGAIVMVIVAVSGLLGFWQERGAAGIVAKLLAVVDVRATVLRDNRETQIAAAHVVAGDMVAVSAGSSVPGDCRLLDARDLFLNEAALTGETYPVEKVAGELAGGHASSQADQCLVHGHSCRERQRAPWSCGPAEPRSSDASRSVCVSALRRRSSSGACATSAYFLMEVTLLLVLAIFAINVYLAEADPGFVALRAGPGRRSDALNCCPRSSASTSPRARRPWLHKGDRQAADGDRELRQHGRALLDKTGTLTEGLVHLHSAVDAAGAENDRVLFHAYLNASFQTGFANPIDEAIRELSGA